MKRLACVASVLAVLAFAARGRPGHADRQAVDEQAAQGGQRPAHPGQVGPQVRDARLAGGQEASKELVVLGAGLPKTEPAKGDKANYARLANAYLDDAKALDDAAKNENKRKPRPPSASSAPRARRAIRCIRASNVTSAFDGTDG